MNNQIKVEAIIEWLTEKKAENIKLYDVENKTGYTDVIVVCEGSADVHNRAIASYLIDMAKEHKLSVLSKEGLDYGHWVLIDLGDVVVHIFLPQTREFYNIDDLFEKVKNGIEQESSK